MSDDRGSVYKEGDVWIFRASSIGMPLRCLASAASGYDPLPAPEYLLKAAAEGNRYEPIVKDRLRELGLRVTGEQGFVELDVTDTLRLRGHLDGFHVMAPEVDHPDSFGWQTMGLDPDDDLILEVKSMSKNVWAKWMKHGFDGFKRYRWQLAVYMHATKRKALYVCINRDTEALDFRVVDEPPVPWQEIRQHVMMADYHRRQGTLPPCDGTSEYTCSFDYLCDAKSMLLEEVESGSDVLIARLAAEYDEQRKLLKDVKARQDIVRDELLTALGDRDGAVADGWSLTQKVGTRRTLDQEKLVEFLAEHGENLDRFYYNKQNSKPTLTVAHLKG
jgi:hypothetical protein